MVTFYTTHCPKCNVLKTKLDEKNVFYKTVEDVDVMQEKGFTSAPILEIDNKILDFVNAIKWVNDMEG